MIFIPAWITNILLLLSCVFSSYQPWRLNRNPVDPWMSLVFFLIAVATLFLTFRQFRMLPPKKAFE